MANDSGNYNIPFGVDAGPFFKGMAEVESRAERAGQNVQETGKEMQHAFSQAASSGDKLAKSIEAPTTAFRTLLDMAKQGGKQLSDALSGKGIGTGFQDKIDLIKKKLAQITNTAAQVDIKFDQNKIVALEKGIKAATTATGEFNVILKYAKEQLAGLQPGSDGFKVLAAQVEHAEEMIHALNLAVGETGEVAAGAAPEVENVVTPGAVTKTQSLRAEFRQIREEMARLELAGQGTSERFLELSRRGGQLEDQIGDISARVRVLGSDTKYIDAGIQAIQGLAGAFTAAQGASALFGDENEEAQKVIQKVTGALAVLQGVQALANALNKDSALVVLVLNALRTKQTATIAAETTAEVANAAATEAVAVAETQATVATTAWNAALLLNPMVLLTVAIIAGVAAIYQFVTAENEAETAAKSLNSELEIQRGIIEDQIKRSDNATKLSIARAKLARANTDALSEIEKKGIEEQQKIRTDFQAFINVDRQKLRENFQNKLIDEKTYLEQSAAIQKQADDNIAAQADLRLQRSLQDIETQEQQQQRAVAIQKAALDARIKIAQDNKAVQDFVLKTARDIAAQEIEDLTNDNEKTLAKIKQSGKDKEAELRSQIAGFRLAIQANNAEIKKINLDVSLGGDPAVAAKQIQVLQNQNAGILKEEQALNQAIVANKISTGKQLTQAELEIQKATVQLRLEGAIQLQDLEKDSLDKDITLLRLNAQAKEAQITEAFKHEAELREQLIKATREKLQRDELKLQTEFNQKVRDNDEQAELLALELITQNAIESTKQEEAKQIALLEIQLKYAKLRAAAILDDGTEESRAQKLSAERAVLALDASLKAAIKKRDGKPVDMFDLLGLSDLTDQQKTAITQAAKSMLDSVSQITDFIVDQYQRQIDKKQEIIDAENEQIDELEDRLEEEKRLRDEGYANNVALLEAELLEKKRQRAEDIKQQEELQKKQAAIQKAQILVDSAAQASNLVTAGTSIFKSFATIPFGLGIPLAIATVALMTGAFVVSKIKALQAVNEGQKLEKGGLVTGKRHSEGGQKYVSADGSGGVVELEKDEFVVNRKSAKKYAPALKAINEDNFSMLSDQYLQSFLEGMGISLNNDIHREAINQGRERDATKLHILTVNAGGPDMGSISDNVAYLANKAREKTERWEDDFYRYEKQGSTTKRIKKKTEF